jgi:hypothetical protein
MERVSEARRKDVLKPEITYGVTLLINVVKDLETPDVSSEGCGFEGRFASLDASMGYFDLEYNK